LTTVIWATDFVIVFLGSPEDHPPKIRIDFLHFQEEGEALLIEFLHEFGNILMKGSGFLGVRILLGQLALQFQPLLIDILPKILGFTEKCLTFFRQIVLVFITQIAHTLTGRDRLLVGYIDTRIAKNQKPYQKNSRNCDHDQQTVGHGIFIVFH